MRLRNIFTNNFYVRKAAMNLISSSYMNNNSLYSNILLYKIQRINSSPYITPEVAIELTNHCNANCIYCCRKSITQPKGKMSDLMYFKIIDDMYNCNFKLLNLTGLGESLLHDNIFDFINYAKKKNIYVKMFTNGSLLTDSSSLRLMKAGLDEIIFSIDTSDKHEFNATRINLDYDSIIYNLKCFSKIKESYSFNTRICIQATLFDNDYHRIKQVYRSFYNIVDLITFQSAFNWGGDTNLHNGPMANKALSDTIPCQLLWFNIVVRWNGIVPLCCADYNSTEIIGDLNHSSIRDVWNGSKLHDIRRLHLSKQKKDVSICKSCNLFPIWW
jgi:MoaA/NifB/PqqE/SkfB family radical SAM enzyme